VPGSRKIVWPETLTDTRMLGLGTGVEQYLKFL